MKGGGPPYLALIGEPAAAPPADWPDRLPAALDAANLDTAGALASRLAPAAGGFQGVLHRPAGAVDALIVLEEELAGLPLRFGLGWGPLDQAPRVAAVGLAGPCLEAARRALARGRVRRRWVTALGWGVRRDKVLNGVFALLGTLRSAWTPRQAEIVAAARRAVSQKEVAAALGVRPSVISEALAAARYRRVLEGEESLRQLFEVLGEP